MIQKRFYFWKTIIKRSKADFREELWGLKCLDSFCTEVLCIKTIKLLLLYLFVVIKYLWGFRLSLLQCQSELVHLVVLVLCLLSRLYRFSSVVWSCSFLLVCFFFLPPYLILLHEYLPFGAGSFIMDWYDHLPNMLIFCVVKTALTPQILQPCRPLAADSLVL